MVDIVRHGVTLTTALQEAAAISPLTRTMLYAYEMWHPSLSEPIRFVNDNVALFATLEFDAPRDAGVEVEFMACRLSVDRPEESDTAASPSVSLSRPDIGGILKKALDEARGSLEPWTLIERLFSSDTSGPAMLPVLSYELTNAQIAGGSANVTASYDDDANVAIPRITFQRKEYPGLKK